MPHMLYPLWIPGFTTRKPYTPHTYNNIAPIISTITSTGQTNTASKTSGTASPEKETKSPVSQKRKLTGSCC